MSNLRLSPFTARLLAGFRISAVAAFTMAILLLPGCDSKPEPAASEDQSPSVVSSVPLRIVSAGGEDFDQRLQVAWKSISEQPIDIIPATGSLIGSEPTSLVQTAMPEISELAKKSDLVIFRNQAMGDLQSQDLLTSLPDSFLESKAIDSKTLLPALAADSLRWGNAIFSIPLGTVRPAVWSRDPFPSPASIDQPIDWDTYREGLKKLEPGQAAEPLADGWAAISFLWRAATLTRGAWLFDRQTLEPMIDSPPYVRALEQLVEDYRYYPEELLSPEEIWRRLNDGELRQAIGWPIPLAGSGVGQASELTMTAFPLASEVFLESWQQANERPEPYLLSPWGLSVGISSACRQTVAARAFMSWLVSREGHQSLRGSDSSVLPNRVSPASESGTSEAAADSPASVNSGTASIPLQQYDEYIREQLDQSTIRPSLRIPATDQYLMILNEAVLSSLSGDLSPQQALTQAANRWDELTTRLGRQTQLNAWRQSQGMRQR